MITLSWYDRIGLITLPAYSIAQTIVLTPYWLQLLVFLALVSVWYVVVQYILLPYINRLIQRRKGCGK